MDRGLTPLDVAQARLLDGAAALPAETVPLAGAHGRVAAADVAQRLANPPVTVSAMDGWAIRFADLPGPWRRLAGEAAAGRAFGGEVRAGEAVRVFTGAALPVGADTVLLQEEAQADRDAVRLAGDGPAVRGAHVRRAGSDFAAGDVLVRAGDVLTAARLGLLAAGGAAGVAVVRRPVVALLCTGDELVAPGVVPGLGQIVASAGPMLGALATAAGAEVRDLGIVPDTMPAMEAALRRAVGADVIVTVGGASVGDHDLVRPALLAAGARIDVWRVAMRPGKPMLFGELGSARVVGLPGNPVSGFVGALLFLLPLLRALGGRRDLLPVPQPMRLAGGMAANGMRRDFVRGVVEAGRVRALPVQDSAQLSALAAADCLIVRPENAPAAEKGSIVNCIMLESRKGSTLGA